MNIAIIQARYNSARLEGKILKKIFNKTILEILISRLKNSKSIDKIVVATTNSKIDLLIVNICKKNKIDFFRGSEKNVLERYFFAAKKYKAKNIIRITSDCPLIDPNLVDIMLKKHIFFKNDYTSNTLTPTFPDGFDIEIFKFSVLKNTFKLAKSLYDKEHVTPFIKRNVKFKKMNFTSKLNLSQIRLTIDYEEDFVLLNNIFKLFNYNFFLNYEEIIKLFKKNPNFFKINNMYMRNEGSLMSTGEKLWEKAKNLIPGGGMLFSKRPQNFLSKGWPTYFSKSKGCKVWDIDNKKFLDFSLMGVGTNTLGYSNKFVDNAVRKIIDRGNMTTLNCPEEVHLAEKLIKMHPWSDKVKFTRSGGEANAVAIRIARAFAKRKKIMVCGYHGWHDWYLSSKMNNKNNFKNHLPSFIKTEGVPKSLGKDIFIFKYNNFRNFKTIFNKNKKQIGIVKMEVSRSDPPKNNFLQKIRQFCKWHNLILIFDECTSGFRESFGGLHLKYKVYPDMLILGKTLGNGYAINAILGKSKIMDTCENTFISSTFWTERIGSAAALETLNQMEKLKSWMIISKKGRLIKKAWKKTFSKYKFKVKISGLDAMPVYNFLDIKNNQIYKTYLIKKMLGKKYLTSNSVYLSISHTDSLIKKYLRDFEKSIKSLRQDIKKNNLNIKNDEISIKSISR